MRTLPHKNQKFKKIIFVGTGLFGGADQGGNGRFVVKMMIKINNWSFQRAEVWCVHSDRVSGGCASILQLQNACSGFYLLVLVVRMWLGGGGVWDKIGCFEHMCGVVMV